MHPIRVRRSESNAYCRSMEVMEGNPATSSPVEPTPVALDDSRARWYVRVVLAFVLGLALGIGGTIGVTRVKHLDIGRGSPLAYASVVDDDSLLVQAVPAVASARLDDNTGSSWGLEAYSTNTAFGAKPLTAAVLARLNASLIVPGIASNDVQGVFTNALDADSVRRNGTLYMLQFGSAPDVRDYLMQHPAAFRDGGADKLHDTYWLGAFAVFYTPDGQKDQTEGLRQFLKEFDWCPKHLGPCAVGESLRTFDAWAPRAKG